MFVRTDEYISLTPEPPMRPTSLETPQNGKGFFQSRLSDAEGRAEPGSTLYLDYANQDLVWHNLGTMTVEWDGPAGHGSVNFQGSVQ